MTLAPLGEVVRLCLVMSMVNMMMLVMMVVRIVKMMMMSMMVILINSYTPPSQLFRDQIRPIWIQFQNIQND